MRRALHLVAWTLVVAACAPEGSRPPTLARALASGEEAGPGQAASDVPPDEPAAADTVPRAELEAAQARIAELEAALDDTRRRRAEREMAWYQYNQALATLAIDDQVEAFPIDPDYEPATVEPPPDGLAFPEDPAAELARRAAERAEELRVSLVAMLKVEQIRGMDLLEVGTLSRGALGPVVFRLLDDRGHLAGSLFAERLRLEASLAGHTVTLVLEDGFEGRGGERVFFRGGVRRIVLPYVDPVPYVDAMPELFPPSKLRPPQNDGEWEPGRVRTDLNALLRHASGGSAWRLRHLDAIRDDTLMGVHLERYDLNGGLAERVFADRVRLQADAASVSMVLWDGVIVRAGERLPFVDGEHRIVLPGAAIDDWRGAALPGIAKETPAETDDPETPAEPAPGSSNPAGPANPGTGRGD